MNSNDKSNLFEQAISNVNFEAGQSHLIGFQNINSETKVQMIIGERIELPNRSDDVLAEMNASDDRFSKRGVRYHWLTSELEDIKRVFGDEYYTNAVDAKANETLVAYHVENPTMSGKPLRIQIIESNQPRNQWDIDNLERSAKRAGAEGEYLLANGMPIFSRTKVVKSDTDPVHELLAYEETVDDIWELDVDLKVAGSTPAPKETTVETTSIAE